MRILFLLTQDLESPAGAGRYFPLARELVRLGHRVSIAALHADFDALLQTHFVQSGVEVYYVAQMHVRKHGNQKSYYPDYHLLPLAARATLALTRAALHIPADVIHIGKPHPMNSLAGLIARYMQDKAVVLDCDDYEAVNNRLRGFWQRWGVTFFENNTPHWVDHITTHTYILRDRLLALGIPLQRITYLPHGVDRERFAAPEPAQLESLRSELGVVGKKVVVFVGSMSLVSHAVTVLLTAFSRVQQVLPDTILCLVGGGEDYERLKRLAHEMGLGEAVRFCGRVHPAQAPLYYRLADVSVDPVHDNEAGRASLSMKIFESWAAETPLVTTDVGDRRIVLGSPPAGVLVRPGDPESLSKAILQLLCNPQEAATLRARGIERVKSFYWDHLVREMESTYLQVIARVRSKVKQVV